MLTDKIVLLTEKQLDDLVYKAVVAGNNIQYDGLFKRYFDRQEKNIRDLLSELSEMNSRLEALVNKCKLKDDPMNHIDYSNIFAEDEEY